MSTERLALVVAGALIVVSAVGIAYLTAEQAGAAKRTDIPVDAVPTVQTRPGATEDTSTTRVAPPPLATSVGALEPSAHGRLGSVSRVTSQALVAGAFGAGSLALARSATEKAVLREPSQ
ncbi:MAG: hypothetical protein ACREJ4_09240 [Candidatus Methylomirabilaceae bacterium]